MLPLDLLWLCLTGHRIGSLIYDERYGNDTCTLLGGCFVLVLGYPRVNTRSVLMTEMVFWELYTRRRLP